ncbi:MAG: hypothetical protein M1835_003131, partial [Candelina submexicana]
MVAGGVAMESGSGGSTVGKSLAELTPDGLETLKLSFCLFLIFASILGTLLVYRVVLHSVRYIRTLTCLNNDTQRYFAKPNLTFANVKKHLLYAPLFRVRHNREFQLSTAMSMGNLPTRLHALLLVGYLGTNIAFCVISISWKERQAVFLPQLRNRTGILSVVNMIPLFIMGGRNNPLIVILHISYDTFNLLHRWLGRVAVLQAVCHTLAWAILLVNKSGWSALSASVSHTPMILTGLVGVFALLAILVQSHSILRHAFYETFLHLHIAIVMVAVVGLWLHLKGLRQKKLVVVVVTIWIIQRLWRMTIFMYRNVSKGRSTAVVEVLPGDAMRVRVNMARPWAFKPGQHMFLYMPSVGLWTSHPFSVAWSGNEDDSNPEKGLAIRQQDAFERQKTTMSLVIRRRTGFTESLYRKAESAVNGRLVVTAYAEGPYGGIHCLHSYGTVLMFAGGVGITHQVSFVRDLVAGFANGTVAARKLVLVWIIQSPEHLEWIRPWMTEILAMDKRREVLRILLFVTRPRSTKEIQSPSATVQMFPGRPNVETLIALEAENQVGAMAVTVCGTGSLSDDVRRAVRCRQTRSNIDLIEESFS